MLIEPAELKGWVSVSRLGRVNMDEIAVVYSKKRPLCRIYNRDLSVHPRRRFKGQTPLRRYCAPDHVDGEWPSGGDDDSVSGDSVPNLVNSSDDESIGDRGALGSG